MIGESGAPSSTGTQSVPNKRFYGKYRGVVIDNIDELMLGRILAIVPTVPGSLLNWALPCAPFTGPEVGHFMMPAIGANVWIEFEGGNPNFPIWCGGFWEELEFPYAEALDPADPALVKVIKTKTATFILNDTPETGGVILETNDPAVDVPVTMVWSSLGMELNCGISNILMTPEEGITLSVGEVIIAMTEEGITMTGPVIAAEAEVDVTIDAGAGVEIDAGADIQIGAGGGIEIDAGADVQIGAGAGIEVDAGADVQIGAGVGIEIDAGADVEIGALGAVEVNALGDVEIGALGAVELNALGDVEIGALGAMELTTIGDIALTSISIMQTGLVEVNGDLLIDGQQPLVI